MGCCGGIRVKEAKCDKVARKAKKHAKRLEKALGRLNISEGYEKVQSDAVITSKVSKIKKDVCFRNSTNVTVFVMWLNYEGKEVFYCELKGGEMYRQSTWGTHPWIVRNAVTHEIMPLVAHKHAKMDHVNSPARTVFIADSELENHVTIV